MASNVLDVASKLESILQCAICFELFREPRTLTCGHVFCDPCLRRMAVPAGHHGGRVVRCPTCTRTCNTNHATKIFILKDMVEAQKSIATMPSMQHACESCEQLNDVEHLWACSQCSVKSTCSKCIIKNGHGQCEQSPRNLAELLLDKQQKVAEWRQKAYDNDVNQTTRSIGDFATRVDEMRRRVLAVRDLLKGVIFAQNGETLLSKIRDDMLAVHKKADIFFKMSVTDKQLSDNLANCDQELANLESRLRMIANDMRVSSGKYDRYFKAVDDFMKALRDILESDVTPSSQLVTNTSLESPASMNHCSPSIGQVMMIDLGIITPDEAVIPAFTQPLDDSMPLIQLEEIQNGFQESAESAVELEQAAAYLVCAQKS